VDTRVDKSKESVHVVSVGAFGRAVAHHLHTFRSDVVETQIENAAEPGAWPATRMNVVVSWRPVRELCEAADRISHDWQLPFVPLIMDAKILRLGPIVIPGCGSCWNCWVRRSLQHGSWPYRRLLVSDYYATHPEAGPQGYLDAFALMAAARVSQTIDELDSGAALAGNIWQIDMLTREITLSRVVGVHDCPRCGLHLPAQSRSYDEMQQHLGYLWNEGAGGQES